VQVRVLFRAQFKAVSFIDAAFAVFVHWALPPIFAYPFLIDKRKQCTMYGIDNLSDWLDYEIPVSGIAVHVRFRQAPDSPDLILFLHGLACSLDTFRDVTAKNYFPDASLLLVDLPGFGRSAKPDSFSYTMEAQAELLAGLLRCFAGEHIHIVAHSMGGAIGLLLAEQIAERIASFTNIEGNLVSGDCGIMSRGIANLSADAYSATLFHDQEREFRGHQQLRFSESTPDAVYKSARSLVAWSDNGQLLKKFHDLQVRNVYFYGEENNTMPVLQQLGFVEKIMIPQSGHGLTTENPDAFYPRLARFIAGVEIPGQG
jgi:pimeloyl-ACP methyl ester carboxylesterase